jgi:hypothetical protein
MNNKLQQVLAKIDVLNADDPNMEQVEGQDVPKEQLYSRRMSEQLKTFLPDASDELQIAAHAQHVRRWTSPRSDYPTGKAGYYRWRTELGRMHADLAAGAMAEAGYPKDSQDRVRKLLTKQGIKQDNEVQALEDVICLVFLQYYFLPFAAEHPEEKVIDILHKTWTKMSERGHQAALALPLEPDARALVEKALA